MDIDCARFAPWSPPAGGLLIGLAGGGLLLFVAMLAGMAGCE